MRKPIQLLHAPESVNFQEAIYALCDDGSVWYMAFHPSSEEPHWEPLPPIPQNSNEGETE